MKISDHSKTKQAVESQARLSSWLLNKPRTPEGGLELWSGCVRGQCWMLRASLQPCKHKCIMHWGDFLWQNTCTLN